MLAVRPVLLLCVLCSSRALLFKPTNPSNVMWDTWLLAQPQEAATDGGVPAYYLNYLSSCDATCGGATGGSWNGVGAATSTDGVHFADEGVVIHKDDGAVWLWCAEPRDRATGVCRECPGVRCWRRRGRRPAAGCVADRDAAL